jgi:hypothetical protein
MFNAYYSSDRFRFIDTELKKSGRINKKSRELLRKTAVFRGDKLNFYIDASDGVNEDLKINEYLNRLYAIYGDTKGKPFLLFKESFSPIWCQDMINYARSINGEVIPFFIISHYLDFYNIYLENRLKYIEEKKDIDKTIDIGFYANLSSYYVSKPTLENPKLGWYDVRHFNEGLPKNTGFFEIKTRENLYKKLINSKFTFANKEKIEYEDFIRDSFQWKVCLNPPGCGEYTPRIIEHAGIGQCVILRKTSYDNAISWAEYFPQIDFELNTWEDDLQKVIDNYKYWEIKSLEYYDKVYKPEVMVKYIFDKIEDFKKEKNI